MIRKMIKVKNKVVVKKEAFPVSKSIGEKKTRNDVKNNGDYTVAILEEMQSEFRAFGEALSFTNKNVEETNERLKRVEAKGDATFEQVGVLTMKVVALEEGQTRLEERQAKLEAGQFKLEAGQAETNKRLGSLELRFGSMEMSMDELKSKIFNIKTEIDDLKNYHSGKAEKERLEKAEKEINFIIKHFNLSFA